nr:MAG TPA_asm: hypothetical protein [Caudoviricetes sp.]
MFFYRDLFVNIIIPLYLYVVNIDNVNIINKPIYMKN